MRRCRDDGKPRTLAEERQPPRRRLQQRGRLYDNTPLRDTTMNARRRRTSKPRTQQRSNDDDDGNKHTQHLKTWLIVNSPTTSHTARVCVRDKRERARALATHSRRAGEKRENEMKDCTRRATHNFSRGAARSRSRVFALSLSHRKHTRDDDNATHRNGGKLVASSEYTNTW